MLTGNKSISLPIGIRGISAGTLALINSGAGGNFVDHNFARQHGLTQKALATPVKVYNVNGTPNKYGTPIMLTSKSLLLKEKN